MYQVDTIMQNTQAYITNCYIGNIIWVDAAWKTGHQPGRYRRVQTINALNKGVLTKRKP